MHVSACRGKMYEPVYKPVPTQKKTDDPLRRDDNQDKERSRERECCPEAQDDHSTRNSIDYCTTPVPSSCTLHSPSWMAGEYSCTPPFVHDEVLIG